MRPSRKLKLQILHKSLRRFQNQVAQDSLTIILSLNVLIHTAVYLIVISNRQFSKIKTLRYQSINKAFTWGNTVNEANNSG